MDERNFLKADHERTDLVEEMIVDAPDPLRG